MATQKMNSTKSLKKKPKAKAKTKSTSSRRLPSPSLRHAIKDELYNVVIVGFCKKTGSFQLLTDCISKESTFDMLSRGLSRAAFSTQS